MKQPKQKSSYIASFHLTQRPSDSPKFDRLDGLRYEIVTTDIQDIWRDLVKTGNNR